MGSSGQGASPLRDVQGLEGVEFSGVSLLRMSFGGRLAVAAAVLAFLWAGVFWALS